MEQLKLIRRTDNEKQTDNNGTFTLVSTKPLVETQKSRIQVLPQLSSQLPKVQIQPQIQSQSSPQTQHPSLQPHVRSNSVVPILSQPSSTNKSSVTPIPIAPKPSIFQQQQQQQQLQKIISEEMRTSEILIVREDRSVSPIIDPGDNDETVPNEDDTMEIDTTVEPVVESNGAKNSHDTSGEEEISVVNDESTNSTDTTVSSNNGDITNDNVNNVNTITGLVSNIDENKGLEQVQN